MRGDSAVDTEVGVVAAIDALIRALLSTGSRVWLTLAPDRLAVPAAGPVEVAQ
jgi:hypothetical protein